MNGSLMNRSKLLATITSSLVLSFLFSLSLGAANKADDNSPQGVHPYKSVTNLSDQKAHWSIAIEGGIDLIDGDFVQKEMSIIPATKVRPAFGIGVEYSFNPMWGLALYYDYLNYGVKTKGHEDEWALWGNMHLGELFVNFNLINAWVPARRKNIVSLYVLVGGGLAFYNADYNSFVEGEPIAHPRKNGKADMAGVISVGAELEFNVTREFSLGLKGLYHMFTADNIDAKVQGNNNDCIEFAALNLRWKINGKKKNHVHNYSSDYTLAGLSMFGGNSAGSAVVDTIIVKDTVVVEHKDTVYMVQNNQDIVQQTSVSQERTPIDIAYAYFAFDDAELNEQSLITIQQVANRLQQDSTLYVEIRGYCDNTGTDEHNEELGQKRAETVMRELIDVYGIDKDRFLPISKGRIQNVKKPYGPNRRVEMRLTTKDELYQLRENYKLQNKQRTDKIQDRRPNTKR